MANSLDTKAQNTLHILRLIRIHGKINKPALTQLTGLTASTVHTIVGHLEEKGIVCCCATAPSTGGRKSMLYCINKDYRTLIAISIRLQHFHIALTDLGLNIIVSRDIPYKIAGHTPEETIETIARELNGMIADNRLLEDQIGGIGINVPGPLDVKRGIVLDLSGAKNWAGFPLLNQFSQYFSCPIYVNKDINDSMYYLDYSRAIEIDKSRVVISIYDGISAALFVNGRIYHGTHSMAGEIGHITVRRDGGLRCSCGNTGCFELYCSDMGILNLYNSAHPTQTPCTDISQIIALAEQNDPDTLNILIHAVTYLSEIIETTVLMYDPDEIILNCRWLYLQRQLFFNLLDRLRSKGLFATRGGINIQLMDNKDMYLFGAAAHVAMEEYFTSAHIYV